MRSCLLIGCCVVVVALGGEAFAADWPGWLGPRRDNVSTETGLLKQWPDGGLKELWEGDTGKGFSSIAVADGKAYTSFNEGPNIVTVCVDATTGKEVWKTPTGPMYRNDHVTENWGPRAAPILDQGSVYVYGPTGILFCLDAKTGRVIYQKNLLDEFGGKLSEWGMSCSPLIEGERMYLTVGGPGGAFCALKKKTGEVIWKSGTHKIGYVSPIGLTLNGQRQIIFASVKNFFGVDADTGRELWRFDFPNSYDCNIPTPVLSGDKMFLSCSYARRCLVLQLIPQGSSTTVKKLWENQALQNQLANSVLVDGHLYGFNKNDLKCIEFATGREKWSARGRDEVKKGALTYAEGNLYVVSEKGNLALVAANPERFELKSVMPNVLGKRCWTMPTVADGKLFVRDEQKMLCFNIKAVARP